MSYIGQTDCDFWFACHIPSQALSQALLIVTKIRRLRRREETFKTRHNVTITNIAPSFYMLSSLFLLLWPLVCASALHVVIHGELGLSPANAAKRDHMSGLENSQNLNYMVNITLGGQLIKVLIDTARYLIFSSFILREILTYIPLSLAAPISGFRVQYQLPMIRACTQNLPTLLAKYLASGLAPDHSGKRSISSRSR